MKKFNNILEGTDCGDAGLPARWRDTAKAKTILRLVPKTPDTGAMVIQFRERRVRYGARASLPGGLLALWKSADVDTPNGPDAGAGGAGSRDRSRR
jgi:hypothetical protein